MPEAMSDSAFIRDLMGRAARVALSYFGRAEPSIKSDGSYVTEADARVQSLLVEGLSGRFPDDGILAEEHGLQRPPRDGSTYWVIDPIDGTSAFVSDLPLWSISLGVVRAGKPHAGYIAVPGAREYFEIGGPDERLLVNRSPEGLAPAGPLGPESLLLTPSRFHRKWTIDPAYAGKARCLSSTAADIAYVAAGRANAALVGKANLWDIAAGLAMLTGVGGAAEWLGSGEPVDAASLLDGSATSDAILVGHPDTLARYRTLIVTI
jgi:fructose-1,6-bisphosphatase/inositol monophosphatase family enzyme